MTPTWKAARTFADLCELMARWLEGTIPTRPGYQPEHGPDTETTALVPLLAACCRAGFLTDSSQPGCDEGGYGGRRWRQRAAVEGFVADPALAAELRSAGRAAGLAVVVDGQRDDRRRGSIPVTTAGNRITTGFGLPVPRRHLRETWLGVSRPAVDQLVAAHQVALIDLEFGPASNRLWTVLTAVISRRTA